MTEAAPLAIEVRGLTKAFDGKTVVDHFDMEVPKGAIYGFLGPNGSGKTTTIRMMCGLLTPDGGGGRCLGYDIRTQSRQIKERVGYMTQRFSLYEDLSIRENLDFIARMYRVPKRKARVDRALQDLGLSSRGSQLAGTLSGGWKQRLSLAACMIHDPELLLLDEPTAGVDPKARRDFWDEIRRLADKGVTVLVSTHYMDEAIQCDFIAYIAYGQKLISGDPHAIPKMTGLSVWRVDGMGVRNGLEEELRQELGVVQVARFGSVLHVAGKDAAALKEVAERYVKRGDHNWTPSTPDLEDAFIHLMASATDNFAGNAAQ